jgi:diacylglycerol kinase family enzyme
MVERLFLLERCFLPFQFAGQTTADTFAASPTYARVVCKTTVVFNIFNFISRSTSDMDSARIDLSELKVGAIINTSSGGCDAADQIDGRFADDKSVTLTKTRQMTLQSSGDIPLFLDGEKVKVGKIAEITFVPKAVNVMVPANLSTKFS